MSLLHLFLRIACVNDANSPGLSDLTPLTMPHDRQMSIFSATDAAAAAAAAVAVRHRSRNIAACYTITPTSAA